MEALYHIQFSNHVGVIVLHERVKFNGDRMLCGKLRKLTAVPLPGVGLLLQMYQEN